MRLPFSMNVRGSSCSSIVIRRPVFWWISALLETSIAAESADDHPIYVMLITETDGADLTDDALLESTPHLDDTGRDRLLSSAPLSFRPSMKCVRVPGPAHLRRRLIRGTRHLADSTSRGATLRGSGLHDSHVRDGLSTLAQVLNDANNHEQSKRDTERHPAGQQYPADRAALDGVFVAASWAT